MDKNYTVKITKQAQSQIQEIIQYISNKFKDPDAALNLLDILEETMLSLAQLPERVALTNEEPWRSNGIHCLPIKNYLIYFWINKQDMIVHITAVVYEKRDQFRQLSQMDIE